MFIRVKKVKKRSGKIYEYAHLVKGVWKRRKLIRTEEGRKFKHFNNSVHKYSDFLGRVYRFEDKQELDFEIFFDNFKDFVNNNEISEVYKKLIEFELLSRGFNDKKGVLHNSGLFVDLKRNCVHDGKGDVVVKIKKHSGYICNKNLEELFEINKIQNKAGGVYLLKKFKSLGMDITPENFYLIADKLLKE